MVIIILSITLSALLKIRFALSMGLFVMTMPTTMQIGTKHSGVKYVAIVAYPMRAVMCAMVKCALVELLPPMNFHGLQELFMMKLLQEYLISPSHVLTEAICARDTSTETIMLDTSLNPFEIGSLCPDDNTNCGQSSKTIPMSGPWSSPELTFHPGFDQGSLLKNAFALVNLSEPSTTVPADFESGMLSPQVGPDTRLDYQPSPNNQNPSPNRMCVEESKLCSAINIYQHHISNVRRNCIKMQFLLTFIIVF